MRPNQTDKFLHGKGNNKQNQNTAYLIRETVRNQCDQQGFNFQNIGRRRPSRPRWACDSHCSRPSWWRSCCRPSRGSSSLKRCGFTGIRHRLPRPAGSSTPGQVSQGGRCSRQPASLPGGQPGPGPEWRLHQHNQTDSGEATPRLLLPLLPGWASPWRLDVHRRQGRGEWGPQELPQWPFFLCICRPGLRILLPGWEVTLLHTTRPREILEILFLSVTPTLCSCNCTVPHLWLQASLAG